MQTVNLSLLVKNDQIYDRFACYVRRNVYAEFCSKASSYK